MQDACCQDREKADQHRSSARLVNEQVIGLNQIKEVCLKTISLLFLIVSLIKKFYLALCPEGKCLQKDCWQAVPVPEKSH